MKLTREQRKKIMNLFPQQRGNVKLDTSRFLDAIIYICENGCTWRACSETFGPWHTIYVRINRQAKKRRAGTDLSRSHGRTDNEQADNGGFPGFKFGESAS
jgi:transposase